MTPQEYERLQDRLRQKLERRPTDMNAKEWEGYKTGIKAAMSILHKMHKHEKESHHEQRKQSRQAVA